MKRPAVIIGLLIVGVLALLFYFQQATPAGVETKGETETIAWISLAVAVISLLTSAVGLIEKVIEIRQKTRD